MITKRVVVDKIEILEDSSIQIREAIVIEEDGVELTRQFHRRAYIPGDDITKETDARISKITTQLWTADVVKSYQDKLSKSSPIGVGVTNGPE